MEEPTLSPGDHCPRCSTPLLDPVASHPNCPGGCFEVQETMPGNSQYSADPQYTNNPEEYPTCIEFHVNPGESANDARAVTVHSQKGFGAIICLPPDHPRLIELTDPFFQENVIDHGHCIVIRLGEESERVFRDRLAEFGNEQ